MVSQVQALIGFKKEKKMATDKKTIISRHYLNITGLLGKTRGKSHAGLRQ